MNALMVKLMAIGITVTQVFTKPVDQIRVQFNPQTDEAAVHQILRDGCAYMMKQFGQEQIDLEPLFLMMIENTKAAQKKAKAESELDTELVPKKEESFSERLSRQIDLDLMLKSYKFYCKNEASEGAGIQLAEVITFYNEVMKDLPDVKLLRGYKLPESTIVLDGNGQRFNEIFGDGNRRTHIPLSEIPEHVRKAFIAAEDKSFYQHSGLDIHGVIRAFASALTSAGRPQGGSTITQQVVKNLLLNDDLTFERKMREMVLAARLEKVLSKDEILELYLNMIYLGRSSWGIEMAAKSYFGKSARDLTVAEAALLAGLTKGPNYYNPAKNMERAKDRRQYVLGRMKEDGYIEDNSFQTANAQGIELVEFESPRLRAGFYYLDAIARQAKELANLELNKSSYTIQSTIHTQLQKAVERSLQDGLASYEASTGRRTWSEPQGSIAEDIEKYQTTWQAVLPQVKARMYDVQWTLAVVLDTRRPRVGLADGRELPLQGPASHIKRFKVYDLIFVSLKSSGRNTVAELKIPPDVQGAAVVIENKTGRVLAITGGFSYAASQFNRATDALRQPGSTLKPFIYLAALNLGYQPNTLIPDVPVRLPPIEARGDWWSPKNYDGGSRGLVTIRRAVEQSLNLPTARIMSQLGSSPREGLAYVQDITKRLGLYEETVKYYPWVLGAQPVRLLDLALAYATVANDGLKPQAHFFDRIESNGQVVYQRPPSTLRPMNEIQRDSVPNSYRIPFYQLRRILEGTLERGTATAMKSLAGKVAGKTGTSNDENDAWFVGFTKDITVAVWVGYDSRRIRRGLGHRFTGGRVALPIAQKILEASFEVYKPAEPLPPPPSEIVSLIAEAPVNLLTGQVGAGQFREVFRRDPSGRYVINSRTRLLRGHEVALGYRQGPSEEDNPFGAPSWDPRFGGWPPYAPRMPGPPPGYYNPGAENPYEMGRRRRRQVDPFFGYPPFFRGFPLGGP